MYENVCVLMIDYLLVLITEIMMFGNFKKLNFICNSYSSLYLRSIQYFVVLDFIKAKKKRNHCEL